MFKQAKTIPAIIAGGFRGPLASPRLLDNGAGLNQVASAGSLSDFSSSAPLSNGLDRLAGHLNALFKSPQKIHRNLPCKQCFHRFLLFTVFCLSLESDRWYVEMSTKSRRRSQVKIQCWLLQAGIIEQSWRRNVYVVVLLIICQQVTGNFM